MELNKILSDSRWGDMAALINTNFEKVKLELMKLRFTSILTFCKGYFSTQARFLAKYPTGKTGEYAFVGTPWPGTVYEWIDTTWVDTGVAPQLGESIFMELLKQHIDNRTIYWDDKDQVIKSVGGISATYNIEVSIDASSVGKCRVDATGSVVSVTPSTDGGTYTVLGNSGGTVTVLIVPEDGYTVSRLNVDKVSQGAASEYTFEKLEANHTMYVWMEATEEVPTEFLVRSDLPGMYYSSTKDALNAVRATYPDGLSQDVTIKCVKPAREKRSGSEWIAVASYWNRGTMYALTIDGDGKLVYDAKSLGGLRFDCCDNICLKNFEVVNFSNSVDDYTPGEADALCFAGDMGIISRNLYVENISFNGTSITNPAKKASSTLNIKKAENVYFFKCRMSGNWGVCANLDGCAFTSFVKNTITMEFSSGVVAHPAVLNASEGNAFIFEDNNVSGDVRECYMSLYNINRIYLRRNKFHDGGGSVLSVSALDSVKECVIENNLFADMLKQPIYAWTKEYMGFGAIDKLIMNNNTFRLSGSHYEHYVVRSGKIGTLDLYNNIIVNATVDASAHGFMFETIRELNSGKNIYQFQVDMGGKTSGRLFQVNNSDGSGDSVTIPMAISNNLAAIQALGFEVDTVAINRDVRLLDAEYAITEECNAQYPADDAYAGALDVMYKKRADSGNSRGCYNLSGVLFDESQDVTVGYSGYDLNESAPFSSSAQYATFADNVLMLMVNTLSREFRKFSIIGSGHKYLILGRYGQTELLPALEENGDYKSDELYTVNID